jgi:chloramphenicol 3-O phosphotransferase
MEPGKVIVLNGTPRSGKSSIARDIQATFDGIWVNLGVDSSMASTPERYRPGIGLRPGGERPDLEPIVAALYRALYGSVVAHVNEGINVVVDVGHHQYFSLSEAARMLGGATAWLVGVRCPVDTVVARRQETGMVAPREMVERWEREVHRLGIYDLEVDTSVSNPTECVEQIRALLGSAPEAFRRLGVGQ